MTFEVIAYEDVNGKIPVQKFLKKLNPKMRAKMYGMLVILQEKGNMLREPYSKNLDVSLEVILPELCTSSIMTEK